MDFRLTDEQKALRDMVRDFAAKEIAPHAQAFDEQGAIPKALLDKMAGLGLMGICVPSEYGGAGMDYFAYIIALEEVCKASASVGLAMTVNNTLYGEPLMRFGTHEQKLRWLAPAAKGERLNRAPINKETLRVKLPRPVEKVLSNGLTVLIAPIFNTVFPQISRLVAADDQQGLRQMYHGASQVMAVLILPVVAVVLLFAREIMTLWTGNAEIALHTAPIVAILVAGTGLNGMLNLPYVLQLAHGRTRITLSINLAFLLAMVPTIFLMVKWFGAIGAAVFWLGLNAFHVFVGVPLIHRQILKGDAPEWFLRDFGFPLLVASGIALVARIILHGPMTPIYAVVSIGITWLVAALLTAFSAPFIRRWLLSMQWVTPPWR